MPAVLAPFPHRSAGRCNRCFTANPPALAMRSGAGGVEHPQSALDAMPAALPAALRSSPNRPL